MSLYNVTTEQDLLEAIVENDEPDTYAHVRAAGLEVMAGQHAIWLDYPMTIAEIRAGIDDLEDQQQAEMPED